MKAPTPPLNYSIFANPTADKAGLRSAWLNVTTDHYELVILLTAAEVD